MRLLLCVLYLVRAIQAAPTTSTNSITNNDGFEALSSVEQRTLWSIVSTCTLTILACTYGAIHPNIPGPNDSSFRILWRRIIIMLVALAAPDVVIAWALRQRLWARHITAQFQEHFSVHNPKDWSEISINERAEAPAEQHEDDAGIHTLAKHAEGYEGTRTRARPLKESFGVDDSEQYEDYTWTQTHSFFALMGGFMLYVDGKPFQTLSPDHLLHLIRTRAICGPTLTANQIRDRSKGNVISKGLILLQGSWFVLQLLSRTIYHLEPTQFEVGTIAFAVLNFVTYALWWNKPLDIQCPHPVYWKSTKSKPEVYVVSDNNDPMPLHAMVVSAIDTFLKFFGIDTTSSPKLRVATFDGVCPVQLKSWEDNALLLAGWTMGSIFSAIHCAAWFYVFPTYEEQLLWRTSAATITIGLWIAFVVVLVLYKWRAVKVDSVISLMFLFTSIGIYVIGRIILVVLMFTTLRNLPADAYKTVSWSNLVPHL